ncbi:MAG: methyltransferase [Thalassotalea sp.]|nr:methyltransferase [Thalassotalea sp.]
MFSPFIINDKNLFLDRYPINQVNRSLQAWDAADEYLVNYVIDNDLLTDDSKLLIFNDNFGAVTLNFNQNKVHSISDSFISQLGLKHNAEQNNLALENIIQLSSLDDLPIKSDVILYKIPKSKNLMVEQLCQIRKILTSETHFIAADKAKSIQSSTLKLFEKHLGITKTSLAVKKARLVFCQCNPELTNNADTKLGQTYTQTKTWMLENSNITIKNYANVFAREKLDIGARLFIQHLPELTNEKKVIDLGCGNGVVGLSLLKNNPKTQLIFTDESHMAVASAKDNVQVNFAESEANCQFMVNDCLTDIEPQSVDIILCNPPFHQQNATTDHIAWQMFKDSYRALKKGGELRIVGNRQLGYHIKLQRIFGNEKLIASNDKFVILSAIKN